MFPHFPLYKPSYHLTGRPCIWGCVFRTSLCPSRPCTLRCRCLRVSVSVLLPDSHETQVSSPCSWEPLFSSSPHFVLAKLGGSHKGRMRMLTWLSMYGKYVCECMCSLTCECRWACATARSSRSEGNPGYCSALSTLFETVFPECCSQLCSPG